MTKKQSVVALIPARGGSKGLPRKNVLKVLGRPLISYTIGAAKSSFLIRDVVVSSEDEEILTIAEKSGATALKRPIEYAEDHSSTFEVIDHFISSYSDIEQYNVLILLQPTSPLRGGEHIDEALRLKISSGATSCISVEKAANSCLKWVQSDGEYVKPLSSKEYPFFRRQDLPEVYRPNGAIYIIDLYSYKKENTLITQLCVPYLMNEIDSLDIDTLEDLQVFKEIIEKK